MFKAQFFQYSHFFYPGQWTEESAYKHWDTLYNAELELDLDQVSIHTTENTHGWATVLNDIMENQRQHIKGEEGKFFEYVTSTCNEIKYNCLQCKFLKAFHKPNFGVAHNKFMEAMHPYYMENWINRSIMAASYVWEEYDTGYYHVWGCVLGHQWQVRWVKDVL